MTPVPDQQARLRALDPSASFIVQAPAGSGKTGLLIQRYLGLLAVVAEPEQILAITFTRKAAAEIRTRILNALHEARKEESGQPQNDHQRRTRELAVAVLKKDREQQWGLYEHPARLRVGTIDSVNARIAGSSPLSAGTISLNRTTDDAGALYQEAARKTLALAVDSDRYGTAAGLLLQHLGNSTDRFERLVIAMLQRRDQWLQIIGSGDDTPLLRERLEAGLRKLIDRSLLRLRSAIPTGHDASITELMDYAARNLARENPASIVVAWAGRREMPDPVGEELALWKGLVTTLLTNENRWRKRLNKHQGFPPKKDGRKDQVAELIAMLREIPSLQPILAEVARLPEPRYADRQWAILEALLSVLPVAAAHLKLVFAARGETDFQEVAHEALRSLGEEGRPTELGLSLDYRISHILVDEFQDTSRSQFDLLQALTRGWMPGDGRTLFLVGDPMQSIYRFREADVSLYIRARDYGIGEVRLEFLRLQANFRSEPAIVEWTNTTFGQLCDEPENIAIGSVAFGPGIAANRDSGAGGVSIHWVPRDEKQQEAACIVALIEKSLEHSADESIAVLVRSRGHAVALIEALRSAKILFQGRGLDSLGQRSVVQDLAALTRALGHVGDRLAWLALLRTPWFGLSLVDLHRLASADLEASIWDLLNSPAVLEQLSADGRQRLDRQRPCLDAALNGKGQHRLRDWVEGVWQELGGVAILDDPEDFECADSFFGYLDRLDRGGDCIDGVQLTETLNELPVSGTRATAPVQLMTMHKAKGLEFDTVILPGLGYRTRTSDRPALLLSQDVYDPDDPVTVLAPIEGSGADNDAIHDFLWHFEQLKDSREQIRLLYVAATRAKKNLHLFAQVTLDNEQHIKPPPAATLLGRLWPAIERRYSLQDVRYATGCGEPRDRPHDSPHWVQIPIRRLPVEWRPSLPPDSCRAMTETAHVDRQAVVFDWASRWAMHVGSVVHRCLQYFAQAGIESWDEANSTQLRPVVERMLKSEGTDDESLHRAADRVMAALAATLEDDRGRWILSAGHQRAANELALTICDRKGFRRLVLDRTFICADGFRWIIDYKTSTHEGGDLDAFLGSEVDRYRPQLAAYRDAMARHDPSEKIRTALYFPLLGIFHEVDTSAGSGPHKEPASENS